MSFEFERELLADRLQAVLKLGKTEFLLGQLGLAQLDELGQQLGFESVGAVFVYAVLVW